MPGVQAAERNQGVRGSNSETDAVVALIATARRAMGEFSSEINAHGQSRIDEAVTALAWSIYQPEQRAAAGGNRGRSDRDRRRRKQGTQEPTQDLRHVCETCCASSPRA